MPHRRTSRRRPRRDLSQLPNLITALTAVGALVFTGLSLQATREQLDIAQTEQITERFTRAVEHLGDDKTMDVRLGAVFALERIARDSVADRAAIGQLLAAFVRRKRPLPGPCTQGLGRNEADIEAALRVVSMGQLAIAPDLSATCLSGADLSAARLRCAVLEGTNLTGSTDLSGADLRGADLTDARLSGADPGGPHSVGANLNEANLELAVLTFADLRHAFLLRANLRGANLAGTTLTGARLENVDLSGARLTNADLRDVDLSEANLTGAHIRGSTFSSPEAKADALARGAVDDDGLFTELPCIR
jgi:uncharacterized protein YjbI with pentapeptide repeats